MEKPKIKVGIFYKTRVGNKVKIYDVTDEYIHGAVFLKGRWRLDSWLFNGKMFNNLVSEHDIISEWTDKVYFDKWESLPEWLNKYIAMDENGDWHCYAEKPKRYSNQWLVLKEIDSIEIPKEYAPEFKGDWKYSLLKNPKYK